MTETKVKSLSSYFNEIVESCANGCELGGIDRDGCDYTKNGICFENDDYYIEGSFGAAAYTTESGDGYWTPYETSIDKAYVSVDELTVYAYNPETEDFDIEVSTEEVNALWEYIEKHLPAYLED